MGNLIKSLDGTIKKLTSSTVPRSINRDDYLDIIAGHQTSLNDVRTSLEKLDTAQLKKITEYTADNKNKKLTGVSAYNNYKNRLLGKAKSDEEKSIFTSLLKTITAHINVLEVIEDHGETLFDSKILTFQNTNVSQVIVMGVVYDAEMLAMYANCLINAIVIDLVPALTYSPKYRVRYMERHFQEAVNVTNDVYSNKPRFRNNGKGIIDIVIKDLKKNNVDVNIVGDDNKNNLKMIKVGKISNGANQNFIGGLFGLNIFRYIGEVWNNYKHSKYLKQKNEKEWMETQIALLALELDESDDEIRKAKLAKIIENYQAQLAKLDRKIQEYLED